MMKRVNLLRTQGYALEAVVEVDGREYTVMDEVSNDSGPPDVPGWRDDLCLKAGLVDILEWDEMFSGNPEKKKIIAQKSGWSYLAYGQITRLNPIMVDVGILEVELWDWSHDPKIVGEFISFSNGRLELSRED